MIEPTIGKSGEPIVPTANPLDYHEPITEPSYVPAPYPYTSGGPEINVDILREMFPTPKTPKPEKPPQAPYTPEPGFMELEGLDTTLKSSKPIDIRFKGMKQGGVQESQRDVSFGAGVRDYSSLSTDDRKYLDAYRAWKSELDTLIEQSGHGYIQGMEPNAILKYERLSAEEKEKADPRNQFEKQYGITAEEIEYLPTELQPQYKQAYQNYSDNVAEWYKDEIKKEISTLTSEVNQNYTKLFMDNQQIFGSQKPYFSQGLPKEKLTKLIEGLQQTIQAAPKWVDTSSGKGIEKVVSEFDKYRQELKGEFAEGVAVSGVYYGMPITFTVPVRKDVPQFGDLPKDVQEVILANRAEQKGGDQGNIARSLYGYTPSEWPDMPQDLKDKWQKNMDLATQMEWFTVALYSPAGTGGAIGSVAGGVGIGGVDISKSEYGSAPSLTQRAAGVYAGSDMAKATAFAYEQMGQKSPYLKEEPIVSQPKIVKSREQEFWEGTRDVGDAMALLREGSQPERDEKGNVKWVKWEQTKDGTWGWQPSIEGLGEMKRGIWYNPNATTYRNVLIVDKKYLADPNDKSLTQNWITWGEFSEAVKSGRIGSPVVIEAKRIEAMVDIYSNKDVQGFLNASKSFKDSFMANIDADTKSANQDLATKAYNTKALIQNAQNISFFASQYDISNPKDWNKVLGAMIRYDEQLSAGAKPENVRWEDVFSDSPIYLAQLKREQEQISDLNKPIESLSISEEQPFTQSGANTTLDDFKMDLTGVVSTRYTVGVKKDDKGGEQYRQLTIEYLDINGKPIVGSSRTYLQGTEVWNKVASYINENVPTGRVVVGELKIVAAPLPVPSIVPPQSLVGVMTQAGASDNITSLEASRFVKGDVEYYPKENKIKSGRDVFIVTSIEGDVVIAESLAPAIGQMVRSVPVKVKFSPIDEAEWSRDVFSLVKEHGMLKPVEQFVPTPVGETHLKAFNPDEWIQASFIKDENLRKTYDYKFDVNNLKDYIGKPILFGKTELPSGTVITIDDLPVTVVKGTGGIEKGQSPIWSVSWVGRDGDTYIAAWDVFSQDFSSWTSISHGSGKSFGVERAWQTSDESIPRNNEGIIIRQVLRSGVVPYLINSVSEWKGPGLGWSAIPFWVVDSKGNSQPAGTKPTIAVGQIVSPLPVPETKVAGTVTQPPPISALESTYHGGKIENPKSAVWINVDENGVTTARNKLQTIEYVIFPNGLFEAYRVVANLASAKTRAPEQRLCDAGSCKTFRSDEVDAIKSEVKSNRLDINDYQPVVVSPSLPSSTQSTVFTQPPLLTLPTQEAVVFTPPSITTNPESYVKSMVATSQFIKWFGGDKDWQTKVDASVVTGKDGKVDYTKTYSKLIEQKLPFFPTPVAPIVKAAPSIAETPYVKQVPYTPQSAEYEFNQRLRVIQDKIDRAVQGGEKLSTEDINFLNIAQSVPKGDYKGQLNYLTIMDKVSAYEKTQVVHPSLPSVETYVGSFAPWGQISLKPLSDETLLDESKREMTEDYNNAKRRQELERYYKTDPVGIALREGLSETEREKLDAETTSSVYDKKIIANWEHPTWFKSSTKQAGKDPMNYVGLAIEMGKEQVIIDKAQRAVIMGEAYRKGESVIMPPTPTPYKFTLGPNIQQQSVLIQPAIKSFDKVNANPKDPTITPQDLVYHDIIKTAKTNTLRQLNVNQAYELIMSSPYPIEMARGEATAGAPQIGGGAETGLKPFESQPYTPTVPSTGEPWFKPADIFQGFRTIKPVMPPVSFDMSIFGGVKGGDGTNMSRIWFDDLSKPAQNIYKTQGSDSLKKAWDSAETLLNNSPYSYKDIDGKLQIDVPAVIRSKKDELVSAVYLLYTDKTISDMLKTQTFTDWSNIEAQSPNYRPLGLNLKAFGIDKDIPAGFGNVLRDQLAEFGDIVTSPSLNERFRENLISPKLPKGSYDKARDELKARLDSGGITKAQYDSEFAKIPKGSYSGDDYVKYESMFAMKGLMDVVKSLPSTKVEVKAYDPVDGKEVLSNGNWYVDVNGIQRPIPVGSVIRTTYNKDTDTFVTKPEPIPVGMIATSGARPESVIWHNGKPIVSYNVEFQPKKLAFLGDKRNVSEYVGARGEQLTEEVLTRTPPPAWFVYGIAKGAVDLGLTIPIMMFDQAGTMREQIVIAGEETGEKRTEALKQAVGVPIGLAGGMAAWFAQRPKAIYTNPAFELPYTLTVLKGPKWAKDVGVGAYRTVTGIKPTALAIENYIMAYYDPRKTNFETVRKAVENVENSIRGMMTPQELVVRREALRSDAQKRVEAIDTIQTSQGTPVTERVYIESKVSSLSSDRDIRGYRVDVNADGTGRVNKNGLVKIQRGGSTLYLMESAAQRVATNHMMSPVDFAKAVEREIDSALQSRGGMYGNTVTDVVNRWRDIVHVDPDISFALRRTPSNKVRPDMMYSASRESETWRRQINQASQNNSHIAISADVGGDLPALWLSNHAAFGFMDRGRPQMGSTPILISLITDEKRDFKNITNDVVNKLWWGDRQAARDILVEKVANGELTDAMYNVSKVVQNQNHAELEAMAFPGYDQIVPIPKNQIPWYARKQGWDTAVIPTRSPVTILNPDGTVFINQGDMVLMAYLTTKNAIAAGKKVPTLAELTLMQALAFTIDARKLLSWETTARRPANQEDRVFTDNPSALRAMQVYDRSASVLDTYVKPDGEIGWIRNPRPRQAMEGLQNPMGGTMREGVEVVMVDRKGRIALSNSFDEPADVASHVGGAIDPFDFGNVMVDQVIHNMWSENGIRVDPKDVHLLGISAGMRKNHTFPGNRVYLVYIGDQFPSTVRGTDLTMSPEMRWAGMWDGQNILDRMVNNGRNIESREVITGKLPVKLYPASYDVLPAALEIYKREYPNHIQPNIDFSQLKVSEGRNFKNRGYTELTNAQTFVAERNKTPYLRYVTRYTADQLSDGRIFMNKARNAGYALSNTGEIMNLFSIGKSGEGSLMLVDAILRGGNNLNCYDGFLPKYYEQFGFEVTRRQPSGVRGTPGTIYMEYRGGANNGADIINTVINKTGKTPTWANRATKEFGAEQRIPVDRTFQEYALSNDFRDLLKFRDPTFSERVSNGTMMTEEQLRVIAQKRQKENIGIQPWVTPPQVNMFLLDLARKVQNKIKTESPNQSVYYAQTPITYAFYLTQKAVELAQKKAGERSQKTGVDIDTAFAEEMGKQVEKLSKINDVDKIRQTLEKDSGEESVYVDNIPNDWHKVGLIEALPTDAKLVLGKDGDMYSDKKGVPYVKDIVNDRVSTWMANETEFKENFIDVYKNTTNIEPSLKDMDIAWTAYNNRKPINVTNQEIYNVAQMSDTGRKLWDNVNNGLISPSDYKVLLDNSIQHLFGYRLSQEKLGNLVNDYVQYSRDIRQGKPKYSDTIVEQIKVEIPERAFIKEEPIKVSREIMREREGEVVPYKGATKGRGRKYIPVVSSERLTETRISEEPLKEEIMAERTKYATEIPKYEERIAEIGRESVGEKPTEGEYTGGEYEPPYEPTYGMEYGRYGTEYQPPYPEYVPPYIPPKTPPVPPRTPPYYPPVVPPKPPTKVPPPPPALARFRNKKGEYEGLIAYKQGWNYRIFYPPFGQNDVLNTRKPVEGIEYHRGLRSAYDSIVRRGGYIPPIITRDMGIMDVRIFTPKDARKPELQFKRDIKYTYKGKKRIAKSPSIRIIRF